MPQLLFYEGEGQDDGYYRALACVRAAAMLYIGGSTITHTTMVFPAVTLVKGMRIISAKISYMAADTRDISIQGVNLGCDDVDSAPNLVTECNASSRTMTSAYVDWTEARHIVGNTRYLSPDFHSAVQEVIDRAGWAPGNDLAVLCVSTLVAGTEISAFSYEAGAAKAPILYITYGDRTGGAML